MGVLWGFLHYGDPADFTYDVVTGISVGSINAVHLASYAVGDELNASEAGADMWRNLKTDDVWKNWHYTPLYGLLFKPGSIDHSPLLAMLEK